MSKRPLDEEENSCSFFLERKKRPCKMKTMEGMTYCPHHSHLGDEKDPKKGPRIPCPFDNSHFCYQSKLQKHLQKCNARKKVFPEYFVHNINASDANESSDKLSVNDIPDEELLALIQKVKLLHSELNVTITPATTLHSLLEKEMDSSTDELNKFKHMKQQAALLSVMEQYNFLKDGSCFIEFGAGKGQLMYWIVKCVLHTDKTSFILIDKKPPKHRSDNKLKGENIQIERLKMDIQHLHLGNIPSIQDKLTKVVGVSKHLCGGATDLAINCLLNTIMIQNDPLKHCHKPLGMLMALCCHHRCTWNTYTGKEFLSEIGISENEFKILSCISSWAVCGLRKTSVTENKEALGADKEIKLEEPFISRYKRLNLSHEEREEIGEQCKRLIDIGRVRYLLSKGFDVQLITYTDKSVSLENVALVAVVKGD